MEYKTETTKETLQEVREPLFVEKRRILSPYAHTSEQCNYLVLHTVSSQRVSVLDMYHGLAFSTTCLFETREVSLGRAHSLFRCSQLEGAGLGNLKLLVSQTHLPRTQEKS